MDPSYDRPDHDPHQGSPLSHYQYPRPGGAVVGLGGHGAALAALRQETAALLHAAPGAPVALPSPRTIHAYDAPHHSPRGDTTTSATGGSSGAASGPIVQALAAAVGPERLFEVRHPPTPSRAH